MISADAQLIILSCPTDSDELPNSGLRDGQLYKTGYSYVNVSPGCTVTDWYVNQTPFPVGSFSMVNVTPIRNIKYQLDIPVCKISDHFQIGRCLGEEVGIFMIF